MRVLVVGTVPPPGGERGLALGRVAADLLAAGDAVELCSPDPRSASHRSGRLAGVRLPLRLVLASRRFDALVLRVEPGLPFGTDTSRLARGLVLALLGLALRGFGRIEVHLDSPVPIPFGLGGRATRGLWSSATRVVVENEEDRDALLAVPWLAGDRVEVVAPGGSTGGERPVSWPAPEHPSLRAAALEAVRARAAATRRLERTGARLMGSPEPSGLSAFEAERAGADAAALARLVARKTVSRLFRARSGS